MKTMHQFKPLFSFVWILLVSLTLFSSCSDSKEGTPVHEEGKESSPTETPSAEVNDKASDSSSASTPSSEESEEKTDEESQVPIKDDTKITYTVLILDNAEEPMTETINVNLTKDGTSVAMATAQNGIATFSVLPDYYTVELDVTENADFYYEKEGLTLSPELTSLAIILYSRLSEATTINGYSTKLDAFCDFEATHIGGTYVEALAGDRTYFLFEPKDQGRYKISLDTSAALMLGCFGDSNVPLRNNIAENLENNSFVLNIKPSNIGITYVLGITSTEKVTVSCPLTIKRIGDAVLDITDIDFDIITAENLPEKFFHSCVNDTVTITDLDITDKNLSVVLNKADGFYHLGTADGPLVYMRIGTPSQYLDALAVVANTAGLSCYFYDENGVLDRKEQYNQLFLDYAEIADPIAGLVPLTEELAYAIQSTGNGAGWWDFRTPTYLFGGTDISPTRAWLFACCTISMKENPTSMSPEY